MDALKNVPPEKLKKLEERFIGKIPIHDAVPSNTSNFVTQSQLLVPSEAFDKEINEIQSNISAKQSLSKIREASNINATVMFFLYRILNSKYSIILIRIAINLTNKIVKKLFLPGKHLNQPRTQRCSLNKSFSTINETGL